jgi:hypothetical protein
VGKCSEIKKLGNWENGGKVGNSWKLENDKKEGKCQERGKMFIKWENVRMCRNGGTV